MNQQPDRWIADRAPEVVRRWVENAVETNRAPAPPPNAVVQFTQRHLIPIDPIQPRDAAIAILRVLRLIDNAREVAP
jgi:hypothetical protein